MIKKKERKRRNGCENESENENEMGETKGDDSVILRQRVASLSFDSRL